MADKKLSERPAGVYVFDEGYGKVYNLEQSKVAAITGEYNAQLDSYRLQQGDNYVRISLKILFPFADNENNVNLWAFLIVTALHPSLYKPAINVYPAEQGFIAYVEWSFWPTIKRMESKQTSTRRF